MKRKYLISAISVMLCLALAPGCAQKTESAEETVYIEEAALEEATLEDEAVALAASPGAVSSAVKETAEKTNTAPVKEKRSDKAVIDYTNTADGYVKAQFTAQTTKSLKAQVKGPKTTYTYNMTAGETEIFPLSDGNGSYQVALYEGVGGNKYALVSSVSFDVVLKDEFGPFLNPNQYVEYNKAPNTIAKAAELTAGVTDPLKKVEKVYDYVVQNLTYDKQKAATVTSGYLPVLDEVLAAKKGICFDYASLMTGMLRSQDVPCKLVIGYAGTAYHAWISVWTAETGWVDGVIYFDGQAWHRMDPTFASSSKQSDAIMKYIGDGSNYTVKYLY